MSLAVVIGLGLVIDRPTTNAVIADVATAASEQVVALTTLLVEHIADNITEPLTDDLGVPPADPAPASAPRRN